MFGWGVVYTLIGIEQDQVSDPDLFWWNRLTRSVQLLLLVLWLWLFGGGEGFDMLLEGNTDRLVLLVLLFLLLWLLFFWEIVQGAVA